jgi:glutathione S-transferase
MHHLELVSHVLCPYVQRAVIALTEKRVPHTRTDIDLAANPAWFRAISPLGRVPLLRVRTEQGVAVLFATTLAHHLIILHQGFALWLLRRDPKLIERGYTPRCRRRRHDGRRHDGRRQDHFH